MNRPSISALDPERRRVAQRVAQRVLRAGQRAWLVGGCVRDLALGRPVSDLDMACALEPEAIENLFDSTLAVGRAFGTILVRDEGVDVELTTFRAEGNYSDARHPEVVRYGVSLEEDAQRRDFTVNALFLDPTNDELRDPEGGLGDLEAGVLRCVGRAVDRFEEDGLRILRLGRFVGSLGFAIDPATREGASSALASLRGVSAERVLGELRRLLGTPGTVRGLRALGTLGALGRLIPGIDSAESTEVPAPGFGELLERRLTVLSGLSDPPGLDLGLACLFDPRIESGFTPGGGQAGAEVDSRLRVEGGLEALRCSKKERAAVLELLDLRGEFELLTGELVTVPRSVIVRIARREGWPRALEFSRAVAGPGAQDRLADLGTRLADVTPEELQRSSPLRATDLFERGIRPGPRVGELLEAALDASWNGEFDGREGALAWLDQEFDTSG